MGRSIRLEDSVYTVIGVLPATFEVPELEGIEVWTPLPFDPAAEDRRDWRGFQVYARLAPGVTLASAQVELAAIQARLGELYPAIDRGWGVDIQPLRDEVVGQVRPAMLAFLGATMLAVLIACLNIATLLLARWNSRAREIAVRAALGGGRSTIVRLLLLESLLLSLAGSGLGLLLGPWVLRAFLLARPAEYPPALIKSRSNRGILGLALLIGLGVPLLVGVAPAFRSSRSDLARLPPVVRFRGTTWEGPRSGAAWSWPSWDWRSCYWSERDSWGGASSICCDGLPGSSGIIW